MNTEQEYFRVKSRQHPPPPPYSPIQIQSFDVVLFFAEIRQDHKILKTFQTQIYIF
jgi:hypothetical protein